MPQSHPSNYNPQSPPPKDLNLLTLNCWGLLHLSALRTPRLAHIGRTLAAADPPLDIVGLQECWTRADYEAIRRHVRDVLPYGKFFHSGSFGGGLAILSRWPLRETSMFAYPLNGRPTAFWRGDWYVGKGVACATIRFGPGEGDVVEVFNTHTHAPYESGPNDSYLCHRTAQAWELGKLLRAALQRGHLVLALGDFNMLPLSLQYRLITHSTSPSSSGVQASTSPFIRDVWRVLHPDSSLGPADHPDEMRRGVPVPGARFNITENGSTSDGLYNTWRWSKARQKRLRAGDPSLVGDDDTDVRGKRLDYIFASTGSAPGSSSGWVVKSAAVTMTERHPELHVSLSDHFAVSTTLTYHTSTTSSAAENVDDAANNAGDTAGLDAQLTYHKQHDGTLPQETYDEILAIIKKYTAREQKEQSWRGISFYVALAVWVGCLVAVWFSPDNYVAFILMLLSSLGLTAGVINGLLALLFFSSELRALKEFEWEVHTAKALTSEDYASLADVDRLGKGNASLKSKAS